MRFPEERLWDHINDGWSRMSFKQRKFWDAIKRPPEEWELKGYGPCWVVALIGEIVIYYNHYEHGFNRSPWSQFGVIERYQSLQDELEGTVQMQLNSLEAGYDVGPWTSGPIAWNMLSSIPDDRFGQGTVFCFAPKGAIAGALVSGYQTLETQSRVLVRLL